MVAAGGRHSVSAGSSERAGVTQGTSALRWAGALNLYLDVTDICLIWQPGPQPGNLVEEPITVFPLRKLTRAGVSSAEQPQVMVCSIRQIVHAPREVAVVDARPT